MNHLSVERLHASDEGSEQACSIMLALHKNGGKGTAEYMRRTTALTPTEVSDALQGLYMRQRVWFDQQAGMWRVGRKSK